MAGVPGTGIVREGTVCESRGEIDRGSEGCGCSGPDTEGMGAGTGGTVILTAMGGGSKVGRILELGAGFEMGRLGRGCDGRDNGDVGIEERSGGIVEPIVIDDGGKVGMRLFSGSEELIGGERVELG